MLTGSMTGAGHSMSISQPAVSRLIHDLEDELKLVLFERQGIHIAPTDQAHQLYREIERHFAGADRIREAARAIRLSTVGYLNIGAMPNLSAFCLPGAISGLLKTHPEVVLSIHPDSSVNLVSMLRHGQLDVVYGSPPPDASDLEHDPFPATQAVCIMPRDHPLQSKPVVTVKDLHDQDFVALGPNSRQRMQLNLAVLQAGVRPNIRVETLHSSSVISHVHHGVGLAVTDPIALIGVSTQDVVVRPFLPTISMEFSAIYLRSARRSRIALALTALLKDVVSEELRRIASWQGAGTHPG
jgi:DNA-binding transcriptional LysR family regulator